MIHATREAGSDLKRLVQKASKVTGVEATRRATRRAWYLVPPKGKETIDLIAQGWKKVPPDKKKELYGTVLDAFRRAL